MIKEELRDMMPDEAIPVLDIYIESHPEDDEAFTLRGLKYWALGERASAIKDYLSALRINPESNARQALESAYAILEYYNKDLLNP